MADDMDADALTEELTIQQVILDSLEGETFDGVEEEKRVARDDIQRLKRLLRAAKHKHNVHGELTWGLLAGTWDRCDVPNRIGLTDIHG